MTNWGILGLGFIANKFVDAIKEVPGNKIIGVASLTKKKSDEIIKKYGINKEHYYENYEDLINSSEIDAIYIATLNNTHFDLIKKCAASKKKILCEKPMTLNYNEAESIFRFIEENKISFLEAFVFRHHKQSQYLCDLIKSGEIGQVYKVESSFGYKVRKTDPNTRLFNKQHGGGAILDVGCYTTSFCLMIAKILLKENLLNFKLENISGSVCETGVDEFAQADLIFNEDLKMSIKSSLRENLQNDCIIYGSKGKIIIPRPWIPNQKSIIEVHINDNYYKQFINSEYTAYAQQIDFFNKKFFNNEDNLLDTFMSNKESLINAKILDTWRNGF